jgi:ribonuclease HII
MRKTKDSASSGDLFPLCEDSFLAFEERAGQGGFQAVAGTDEAGRGPLAGPVVAAAVLFPAGLQIPGLKESKQLSPARREHFFRLIRSQALAVGVGLVFPAEIDRINILQASLRAMAMAVTSMKQSPDFLLVDGTFPVPLPLPQLFLKKGDCRCHAIAAASIIAKVVRDHIMVAYDARYPGYGFAAHKGYPSASHRAAIAALGVSPIHRLTFRGVREFVGKR